MRLIPYSLNSDYVSEIGFVNTSEGMQEIAQSGPHAFSSIGVNLTDAIAIIVTRPCMSAMINGDVIAFNSVVSILFLAIDHRY